MARRSVKSAVRVLEVLECFANARTALTQRAIVERLGYPQSSTAFLLRNLVDTGYLSYDRRHRSYFPTPSVLNIGQWLADSAYRCMFDQSPLSRLLECLRDRSGETASLSMQNDVHVHWHRILRPRAATDTYVVEGRTYPLTSSSFGWALLSRHSDGEVEKLCRLINAQEPDRASRIGIEDAQRRVEKVRGDRFCLMPNTHVVGRASVATPLAIEVAGRPVAIGIGGPTERIMERKDELTFMLLATVGEFACELTAMSSSAATLDEDARLVLAPALPQATIRSRA